MNRKSNSFIQFCADWRVMQFYAYFLLIWWNDMMEAFLMPLFKFPQKVSSLFMEKCKTSLNYRTWNIIIWLNFVARFNIRASMYSRSLRMAELSVKYYLIKRNCVRFVTYGLDFKSRFVSKSKNKLDNYIYIIMWTNVLLN